jgi:hypothetical protein
MALNSVMLNVYAECSNQAYYAECRYTKCHYAECGYAECRYGECRVAVNTTAGVPACVFVTSRPFHSCQKFASKARAFPNEVLRGASPRNFGPREPLQPSLKFGSKI